MTWFVFSAPRLFPFILQWSSITQRCVYFVLICVPYYSVSTMRVGIMSVSTAVLSATSSTLYGIVNTQQIFARKKYPFLPHLLIISTGRLWILLIPKKSMCVLQGDYVNVKWTVEQNRAPASIRLFKTATGILYTILEPCSVGQRMVSRTVLSINFYIYPYKTFCNDGNILYLHWSIGQTPRADGYHVQLVT